MKTKYKIAMAMAAGAFLAVAPGRAAADNVTSYSAPKGHPPISQIVAGVCPAPGVRMNGAPIHWTTPAEWTQVPATAIRIGNFLITGQDGKKAEVAITAFPGTVGTELDNVNRWRSEIGLELVDEGGISSQIVTVDSLQGKLYGFAGVSANTVVVSLPREGRTWFFKLRGDKAVVDGAKGTFLDFLKSVHFSRDAVQEPPGTLAATPTDARAGVLPAVDKSTGEPNWNPPSTWKANQSGQMIVKSYSVSGDSGQNATIAISVFPGEVGGTFANVNRWRAQMGLAPIVQKDLAEATVSLPVSGGDAVLVDLTNPKAQAGSPARLVAVIVPQGDRTWFYKLAGDQSVVAKEKDGFVKFVQAVRYP